MDDSPALSDMSTSQQQSCFRQIANNQPNRHRPTSSMQQLETMQQTPIQRLLGNNQQPIMMQKLRAAAQNQQQIQQQMIQQQQVNNKALRSSRSAGCSPALSDASVNSGSQQSSIGKSPIQSMEHAANAFGSWSKSASSSPASLDNAGMKTMHMNHQAGGAMQANIGNNVQFGSLKPASGSRAAAAALGTQKFDEKADATTMSSAATHVDFVEPSN